MNDIKSLLMAATILAIGGLGLYMYKTEDSEIYDDDKSINSYTSENSNTSLEEYIDDYKEKPKNGRTKKNNNKNKGTRKKY